MLRSLDLTLLLALSFAAAPAARALPQGSSPTPAVEEPSTGADEEEAEGDKKVLAESRMPAKALNFHKADGDSETERKARLNQTTESDYYDFYFHDFKKNYMEPSKEYLRYRELQKHKAALEEKDSDEESQNSL